jgi:dTDP-4-dehydrorhamnose reductase
MRVLVMGASGMLGHKVYQTMAAAEHQIYGTLKRPVGDFEKYGIFDPEGMIEGVDARIPETIERAFLIARPEVVINCIGLIKPFSNDPASTIELNALFPHKLARYCGLMGARLVQISTDCVFSGQKGMYTEGDTPDPDDIYGRTKLLGEVIGEGCITIRTSMIGRELDRQASLLEWFLSQEGKRLKGFTRSIFSGLTTLSLAGVLNRIVTDQRELAGLYHVSSEPINKYDLLMRLKEAYQLQVEIEPVEGDCVDRSLDSSRFHQATGIILPTWDEMIHQLSLDTTPYT